MVTNPHESRQLIADSLDSPFQGPTMSDGASNPEQTQTSVSFSGQARAGNPRHSRPEPDPFTRCLFSLVGEEGTKENSPLKAGTYTAKADKYMKVEAVGIVTRKNGTEIKNWFDRGSLNGQVKVTSVSGDTATGLLCGCTGEASCCSLKRSSTFMGRRAGGPAHT